MLFNISILLLLSTSPVTNGDSFEDNTRVTGEDNPFRTFISNINNSLPIVRGLLSGAVGTINELGGFQTFLKVAENLVKGLISTRGIVPVLSQDTWWGDGPVGPDDVTIRPFRVHFDQQMVSDLRYRLQFRKNFTRPLKGAAFTYGTNADFLDHILDYWSHGYDFQGREDYLNKYPQYITNIQGLDIHYIHIKPVSDKRILPIILLHGWPMTAYEFLHVIDYLLESKEDCDFVFEIIAPDLPGYGYSQGTNKIGLAPYQIGVILNNLVKRLGHERYYIHAGDVGHIVADTMCVMYPGRVLGLHSNTAFSLLPETLVKYFLGQLYPPAVVLPQYEERLYPISSYIYFLLMNSGYFHVQGTRPDMLGKGLEDSPSGLASWIIHNVILGTGVQNTYHWDGRFTHHYDSNDIIDSLTVYWDAQCITTANRFYAEYSAWFQNPLNLVFLSTPTKVPFAALKFRYEVIYQPDNFLRDKYPNLVQSTTLDFGGHFAGYQHPDILADSIWKAIRKMETFNGINRDSIQL